jgi:hypothetical protein
MGFRNLGVNSQSAVSRETKRFWESKKALPSKNGRAKSSK